ncbi:MAG TPA: TonB-dependent receptor [Nevskia sp.]|nr:TonB-dependent receptor [Nevskia sp.]
MLHRAILRAAMLSLPAACCIPAIHADQPTTLGEIRVSASRSDSRLQDLPVSATVLDRQDIERTPAQSLDQLLLAVPGINLPEPPSFAQHPTADSVSMRGLGGIRTLVLLDGVPLNDAFFGYVQWNQVPLDAIERIEVMRGGASSLWGTYAMGGVINIVTRPPQGNAASLSAGYGSYGTSQLDASGSVAAAPWLRLGLRGDRFDTDGYNTTPEAQRGPIDVATSFRQNNLQASALFDFGAALTGYLRGNYHENRQVLVSAGDRNTQHDADLAAGLTRKFADHSRLEAGLWYQDSHFQTANTATPQGAQPGQAEFLQNLHETPVRDFGSSLLWSKALSEGVPQLQVGADFRQIAGADTARIYDESGAQVRTDLGQGRQQFVGVFGQLGLAPLPAPLRVDLSLRYDHFRNYDGFDGNPGGQGVTPDRAKDSFDPRLALRYALSPALALRGAVYRAFRAPTLDNLYRGFSTTAGTFLPNSQLDPETLFGAEIGADWSRGPLAAQLTLFRNDIDNLIGSRNLAASELPPGFFFGSVNINVGKVRSQGIESSGQWTIAPRLRAEASYTYTRSEVLENAQDPGSVGKQTAGIPRNSASAGLDWQPLPPWDVSVHARWADHSYGDADNTLDQEAHFLADLYSSYALSRAVQLFGSLSNAFDRRYIAGNSGFEPAKLGPPLQLFGGIKVHFQ